LGGSLSRWLRCESVLTIATYVFDLFARQTMQRALFSWK
jgi:hypothetical protein